MTATKNTPEPTGSPYAPRELEVVRRFVNTLDLENAPDELSSPARLRAWLEERGLPAPVELDEGDLRTAIDLREALRQLMLANNGEPHDVSAVAKLNEAAESARLTVRFEDGGKASRLAPAGSGVEAALGAILAIVFRSMAEGTWPRLKACRSETCKWAFYDHSKNRSATWCSMQSCGNRAKARAYRRRHRHEASA
jgi:predicted RNA-binding Zn ribbon-like protein